VQLAVDGAEPAHGVRARICRGHRHRIVRLGRPPRGAAQRIKRGPSLRPRRRAMRGSELRNKTRGRARHRLSWRAAPRSRASAGRT
jgi:hypothetical protein